MLRVQHRVEMALMELPRLIDEWRDFGDSIRSEPLHNDEGCARKKCGSVRQALKHDRLGCRAEGLDLQRYDTVRASVGENFRFQSLTGVLCIFSFVFKF